MNTIRKSMPQETRDKISAAMKGRSPTRKCIEAARLLKIGVPRTLECRIKISASKKGMRVSPRTEFKKGMIPWNFGKKGFGAREKNGNWKGGIRYDIGGYIIILDPTNVMSGKSGYVLEHRLVVSNILGRPLDKKEDVHHINKIKDDNRPENLMAFVSRSVHVKFERWGITKPKNIIFDGRKYALPKVS